MKKRFLAMLLVAALVLCMVPTVSASTYNGTCGDNLDWSFDSETGVLRISGTGEMNNYGQNGPSYPWKNYRTQITSVVIEDGCTAIGQYAFLSMSSLTEVSIAESVTNIYKGAFSGCSKLTEIRLPSGLTNLHYGIFSNCTSLERVNLPEGIIGVGDNAFHSCKSLKEISIPGSVVEIGNSAFSGCKALEEVTLAEGIREIGSAAFNGCSALTSVTVPSTVKTINVGAFQYCTGLVIADIRGCKTLEGQSFIGCSGLKKVTLPQGLETVGYNCFDECSTLTHIRFPASVTSISNYALQRCDNLMQVVIENAACSIHDNAQLGIVRTAVIYGYDGSTAERYARANGYSFKDISLAGLEPDVQLPSTPDAPDNPTTPNDPSGAPPQRQTARPAATPLPSQMCAPVPITMTQYCGPWRKESPPG